jgi:hypothetical protein
MLVRLYLIGCLCLVADHSFAQPARLAREFQQGVDAYRLGEYVRARGHLEKARDLDPTLPGPYRFLAAVARAERRFEDCVTHAAEALRVAPASREAVDTRKLHETCRASDGRAPFAGQYGEGGAISVIAQVDGAAVGAAVAIDGKASGSTPLAPRAIPAGPHQIRVSRAGEAVVTTDITVLPGIVTDVRVVLGAARVAVPVLEPGWIELPADVLAAAHVKVLIDGKVVDRAARITLASGPHLVVILRRGKKAWSRSVKLIPGEATKVPPIFHDRARSRRSSER